MTLPLAISFARAFVPAVYALATGFGSFVLRDKKQRVGRNPKTGVEVPITPRRVMTFRASQLLKKRIAEGG